MLKTEGHDPREKGNYERSRREGAGLCTVMYPHSFNRLTSFSNSNEGHVVLGLGDKAMHPIARSLRVYTFSQGGRKKKWRASWRSK